MILLWYLFYSYGTAYAISITKVVKMNKSFQIKEVIARMKKVLLLALALVISVALVTTVMAQAKPEAKPADKPATAPEKATAPATEKKADKPEQKAAPKAKTFKGEFVSMDPTAKTIVAKDGKGEMTFDVSGVKKLAEFKAGDKIMVSYMEKDGKMAAKTVVKQAAKKEAPKKEEAKPAPAPGPAPAKK